MSKSICEMSASELSLVIADRKISCAEVMQAYLARIHRYNPVYTAIVSMLDDDILLQQAERADQELSAGIYRGWMHGMPHAVKDLAHAFGLETSMGSRIFAGTRPSADDMHIARIRNHGAIFIGKTNVPEFGLGSQSYNDVFGCTKNAYNPNLVAGGSSGGAAAALALQLVPVADGSDMMGSLRNPAAFNNIIGFRPSYGRIPKSPNDDQYYQQLPVNGPMGRTVEDTIRLLETMSGYDVRAPQSLRDIIPGFSQYQKTELTGFRIAWMGDYDGHVPMESGIIELCEANLKIIESHGAIVENTVPAYDMDRLWRTWLTCRHWALGSKQNLYDDPEKRKLLKPEACWEIEGSHGMLASRVAEAGIARSDWYRALQDMFEQHDILALPTAQVFPFSADTHWPKTIAGKEMDSYHRWMEIVIGPSLAGLPAVNVPVGFDATGRPMGMQFIGRLGDDQKVLECALAYEAVTDHLQQRPVLQG